VCYILARSRTFADPKFLKILYFAFIQSHLQHAIFLWGCANISTLKPLVTLQKKCIRVVCKSGFLDHTDPLFKNANVLKIRELYALSIIKYAVKRNLIATLQPLISNRFTGLVTYSFNPKTTRLLNCYEVHLVKLLNYFCRHFPYLDTTDICSVKSLIPTLDINGILYGLH